MKERTCPKCGKKYNGCPSLSRKDNKTKICSACGISESLEDLYNYEYKRRLKEQKRIIKEAPTLV